MTNWRCELGATSDYEHAPGPSFDEVWERLKVVLGIKRQGELALMLGIKSPSVTDAKKRGYFPLSWAYLIALRHEISLDLILFGRNSAEDAESVQAIQRKPIYIDSAVELVDEAVKVSGCHINSEQKAALVSIIREELKKRRRI